MSITIDGQKPVDCLLNYERSTIKWVIGAVLEQIRDLIYAKSSFEDSYVRLMDEFDNWAIVLHRDDVVLSPVVPSYQAPDYGYVVLFSHLVDVVLNEFNGLGDEASELDGEVDAQEWSKSTLSKDFDRLSDGMDGYFLSYEDFGVGNLIGSLMIQKAANEPYYYHDCISFIYKLPGRGRNYDVGVETKILYVVIPRAYREKLASLGYTDCLKTLYELFGLEYEDEY